MAASPSADIPQFDISSEPGPDGVWIVRVAGEVDMSHEDALRTELQQASESGSGGIVVDLTECDFIDSTGVRALLLSREAQKAEGERVAVAASSDQILRILTVMGLNEVLPIHPTVDEAAAGLTQGASES